MVRRLRARSRAGAAEVEAGLDAVRFEPRAAAGDAGDFGDGEFGEQFGLVVGVLDRDGLVGLGGVGEELGERGVRAKATVMGTPEVLDVLADQFGGGAIAPLRAGSPSQKNSSME